MSRRKPGFPRTEGLRHCAVTGGRPARATTCLRGNPGVAGIAVR